MYFFEGGLRRVRPYFYVFSLHVKQRMMGKSVLQGMQEEFTAQSPQYYERAIQDGRIRVNGMHVDAGHVLRGHDVITHRLHRHEPPVTQESVKVLQETQDYVAVYKPASIPVHPTGRYRLNSLIMLLQHDLQYPHKVYPSHRLDRLTSGLMVLGKSVDAARRFSDLLLQEGAVQKKYVALVHGAFPDGEVVRVDKPIRVFGRHDGGVCVVTDAEDTEGKPSCSEFSRVWYDEHRNVSLVQCIPRTGRTHQLRVHLQHLGHPIVDDPLYGPDRKVGGGNVIDSLGNTLEDYQKETSNKCSECGESLFEDPTLFAIHLHAFQYSGPSFDFSCPWPEWANAQEKN